MLNIENKRQESYVEPELLYTPEQEYDELMEQHPAEWIAEIGNNGKIMALFDKSQHERNK
jgi:hypothetical protein